MKQQSIKFVIKQDGTVTEEVQGAFGDTCLNLTRDLEKKLGDLETRVHTSEYFKQTIENTEDVTLQHHQD